MGKLTEVQKEVLGRAGRFRPVHEVSQKSEWWWWAKVKPNGAMYVPQLGGGRASTPAP